VLHRDRAIALAALAALTALAWIYLFVTAAEMRAPAMMSMPGMEGMVMPGMAMQAPASPEGEFLLAFLMWAVMMIGMMLPSAAPMILIYVRVARQAAEQGKAFAPAGIFVLGYLLTWTAFALAAAAIQLWLARGGLLTPMLVSTSHVLNAVLLLSAGIYQWLPIKNACLTECRAPLSFVQRQGGFRGSAGGALKLGFRHGLYCVGCCWVLMALLFVGGVMNLAWVAGLAAIVLLEKVAPQGFLLSRALGLALMAAGLIFLIAGVRT
jgi:predicted metal-binding membrane protein